MAWLHQCWWGKDKIGADNGKQSYAGRSIARESTRQRQPAHTNRSGRREARHIEKTCGATEPHMNRDRLTTVRPCTQYTAPSHACLHTSKPCSCQWSLSVPPRTVCHRPQPGDVSPRSPPWVQAPSIPVGWSSKGTCQGWHRQCTCCKATNMRCNSRQVCSWLRARVQFCAC